MCTNFSYMTKNRSPGRRPPARPGPRRPTGARGTLGRRAASVRSPKRADLLSATLASGALARLVTHFAAHPDEALHVRALQRRTGLTPRSLQIELARLERLGVIRRRPEERQVQYVLVEGSSRWRVLRELVRELADPVDVVRGALAEVPGVAAAFVFGSFVRDDTRDDSDIDVLIVDDGIHQDLLARRMLDAGVLLGREVNHVQMTREEMRRRLATGRGFLTRILAGPKRWLIGNNRALGTEISARETA